MRDINDGLFSFIKKSPSVFHVIDNIKYILNNNGFTELRENDKWGITTGGKYYVIRNGSSIISFIIGKRIDKYHFQLTASHSDSPTYKLKDIPLLKGNNGYLKLNVEGYGGMIASSWLDRPLSIAGRVMISENDRVYSRLVNIDKDLLIIPNVAIHMNRNVNKGEPLNPQIDMLPLFSDTTEDNVFESLVASAAGCKNEYIIGSDLYLYNRMNPITWGSKNEFIASQKLDDLGCVYPSLMSFIDGGMSDNKINVFTCFDNEEVGSGTKQGAASTFLEESLKRINMALGKNEEDYYSSVSRSFMVSCDNAHAVHPNHPEKTDDINCTYMNKGIVIKHNANQRYTTDAFSNAIFKKICMRAEVPTQTFANRSDMAGGSTLGNISTTKVSMHTVDIGLPQLAMHSSFETAGSKDEQYLYEALKCFYESDIQIDGSESFTLL